MQDPNEDTEWNDILRTKGVLPPKTDTKDALTIDQIEDIVDETVESRLGIKKVVDPDELEDVQDETELAIIARLRDQRMAELKCKRDKEIFGSVVEITAIDYKAQVNECVSDVVLHLYQNGLPLCAQINQHLSTLATRYPATKFIKSIAKTCVENFPEDRLPTLFLYRNGQLRHQLFYPTDVPVEYGSISLKTFEKLLAAKEIAEIKMKLDNESCTDESEQHEYGRRTIRSAFNCDYDDD